jgi:hypothetical protein
VNGEHPQPQPEQVDFLRLVAALDAVPNDGPLNWEDWNRIGMAVWRATGGSGHGLRAFADWSMRNPHGSRRETSARERWNHYATSPPTELNAATIFYLAAEAKARAYAEQKQIDPAFDPGEPPPGPPPPEPEEVDLSTLSTNLQSAPDLPLDIFGPEWQAWISDAAEAASCAPDYVVAPLLASASALVGNARWAQATPGWVEPPHLWCCSVGESGAGKSPGAKTLMRDVLPIVEHMMALDFPDQVREWQAKAEAYEAVQEVWQREVRTAHKMKVPPPLPPGGERPQKPEMPRLRQMDVTIEKVATLLATAAPKGLMICRDELVGWISGMNSYNDAGRAFWIECYGGTPFRVERQKHPEPIDIPHLVTAVWGGSQPERVLAALNEIDDGLAARIIWFWPEPLPFRLSRATPGTEFATAALDRLRLLTMREVAPGKMEPVRVRLVAEAVPKLERFAQEMQGQQRETFGLLASAYGKARGLCLRLSLVIEYLRWCGRQGTDAPPIEIGREAFEAARTLVADYLMPMAARVFGDAVRPKVERNATELARWIARARPAEVHVRHVIRKVRLPRLKKAEDVHAACSELVDAGWLMPPPRGDGHGRARQAYAINPKLYPALDAENRWET